MTKYKCYYSYKDLKFTAISDYFADFKDGFWITEDFVYNTLYEGKYWIPPNQISLIERISNYGETS